MSNRPVSVAAHWEFGEGTGLAAADSSSHGHTLTGVTDFVWTNGPAAGGAVAFDGVTQWLASTEPVLRTDQSFSVAAWVRLDRDRLGNQVRFPPDVYAVTAVSQSGPTHSSFYLGARLIEERDIHWCFTLSPEDGVSIEWQHAASSAPVDDTALNTWVMLIGVSDVDSRTTHMYVPSIGDDATVHLPDAWSYWHADGALQVGQGLFQSKPADLWPGAIGAVWAFSGALTPKKAETLYSTSVLGTS